MQIYRYAISSVVALAALMIVAASCATGVGRGRGHELPQYTGPGWRNVKIVAGGYAPNVIFNTSRQGLAYIRTDMGGAYRWNPDNRSWIPLTDFAGVDDWGLLGIASLATCSVEPNRLILAAGTYTNDWEPINASMLVSDDYGDTFTRVMMPFKMGGNMPGRGAGERLAIDPNDNSIVYFGSFGDGLWRSRDYGHTWEEVTSFPTRGNVYDRDFWHYTQWTDPATGVHSEHRFFFGIMWVIFDPASGTPGSGSSNIYVGVADTGHTIFHSSDGGETWQPLAGQPTRNVHTDRAPHAHLSQYCPCDNYYPIRGIFSPYGGGSLITAWNHGFGPFSSAFQGGAIWRFTFATREWEDISLPQRDFEPHHKTQDRGVGSVAVDWQNPNYMVATTMNEWWPDEVIFRTRDGGRNWEPIWFMDGWPDRVNRFTIDISVAPWLSWGQVPEPPEQSPKLGWMMTGIAIDPFDSNVMKYTTGATVFGTRNLTDWDRGRRVNIEVMAEGMEHTAVLHLMVPSSGDILLFSGMADVGGFVHRDLQRAPHMIVNPNIMSVVSIDYATQRPNYLIRMGDGELGISDNGGRSWRPAVNFVQPALEIGSAGWTGHVAVSGDARVIMWAPIDLIPHWSDNEGRTWIPSEGLPMGAKIVSDRVNPNRFFAFGSADGGNTFFASEDAGRTFQVMNDNFVVGNRTAKDMRAVVGMEGHIWLATGEAGIYHSGDGGRTWIQLPNIDRADIIGLGMAAPGAEYQTLFTNARISGQWGVWRSIDKGQSWERINCDNTQFGVANSTITGDPRRFGRVFLGTNGRGIQMFDLD